MPNVDFEDPMDFSVGVDALQLEVRGTGVTSSGPVAVAGGSRQMVQFSLLRIDTYEDFQRAFDLSADASASYGLFHGSAKFNFAESHKFNSFSRYLVASVVVTNAFRQVHDIQFTPSARDLLENGKEDRFREEFGDTFVLGIKTGGAYHAVLEFTSESEQDLQNISGALNVAYYGVFDGSTSFSSAMQQFRGHTSLQISSFQQGGTDTAVAVSIDDIIKKATSFPPEVANVAVPYEAFLQDYKTLDLPSGVNFVDIENAKLVLQNFLSVRNQLVQKMNEIEYIQLHSDQFVNPEQFDLAGTHTQLAKALNEITQNASACVNKVKDCSFSTPQLPTVTLPQRKGGIPQPPTGITGATGIKSMVLRSDGKSGYVLDGSGNITLFGGAPAVSGGPYWPNWDIARGIVLRSDGVSGYVLDGYGGVHPFGGAPAVSTSVYWLGKDVARSIALAPGSDSTGMYINVNGDIGSFQL